MFFVSTDILIGMKALSLTCKNCGNSFIKTEKEYNRQIKNGRHYFYCSQSCSSSDTQLVCEKVNRKCLWCENVFESTTHKKHKKCCSKICAHRVSQSYIDRNQVSEKLKKYKVCPVCKKEFNGRSIYCSKLCVSNKRQSHLIGYEKYKRQCQFNFTLSDYPKEFNFDIIKEHGWYSAKNKGDNPNGVSRDHIISVRWAFENGVNPELIKHPANCQLMRHKDNVSKGKKESISVNALLEKIQVWNDKYLGSKH